jgi:hypothetical protein
MWEGGVSQLTVLIRGKQGVQAGNRPVLFGQQRRLSRYSRRPVQ